ncbi:hypothetical protein PPYR_11035 [Photinus pyralis]|nr:hypothetical protein PPYR_11035 [Photinus pyralis]
MLGRPMRTKFDILRPAQEKTPSGNLLPVTRKLKVGERVCARNYVGSEKWKFGTILAVYGSRHYLIHLDNGHVLKRHINQLRSTQVEKPEPPMPTPNRRKVSFAPNLPIVHIYNGNQSDPSNNLVPTQQEREVGEQPEAATQPEPAAQPEPQLILRRSNRIRNQPVWIQEYVTK